MNTKPVKICLVLLFAVQLIIAGAATRFSPFLLAFNIFPGIIWITLMLVSLKRFKELSIIFKVSLAFHTVILVVAPMAFCLYWIFSNISSSTSTAAIALVTVPAYVVLASLALFIVHVLVMAVKRLVTGKA